MFKKFQQDIPGGRSVGTFPGKDGQMITYTEEDVYKTILKLI